MWIGSQSFVAGTFPWSFGQNFKKSRMIVDLAFVPTGVFACNQSQIRIREHAADGSRWARS